MKKLTQIGGLAGIVALSLGIAVEIIQQRFSTLVIFHLLAGGILILISFIYNSKEIKEILTKRSAKLGPQTIIQALLFLAILVFTNILIFEHDFIKDFTNRHLYTLSKMSNETIQHLPGTVDVIAFFPGGGQSNYRQRLQIYNAKTKMFNLRFVDPDKNEELARTEAIPMEAGVLFKYKGKKVWINKLEEADITNALIKVTRNIEPRVWFVSGHGEPEIDSQTQNGIARLKILLEQQGYKPEKADLTIIQEIPEDISMVALVGPAISPSAHEIKVLDYYLANGGNLILFLDPVFDQRLITGFEYFLKPYGINTKWNIIFDPVNHLANDELGVKIIVNDFSNLHPITEGVTQAKAMFYLTRSFEKEPDPTQTIMVSSIINTSKDSYEKVILP